MDFLGKIKLEQLEIDNEHDMHGNKMDKQDYRYCIKKLADMIHDERGLKRLYAFANRIFINSDNMEMGSFSK